MKKTSKLLALALGPLTIASLLLPAVLGNGPVSILVLLWGIQPICSFLAGLWLGRKAGVVWSCAVGALLVSFLGVVIYYNGSLYLQRGKCRGYACRLYCSQWSVASAWAGRARRGRTGCTGRERTR